MRILLVEDDPDYAFLLEKMLQRNQTELSLFQCTDLKSATEWIEEESADLILLDLSLPDGAGLKTIIQMLGTAPHTPIIVLTGLDDEDLAVKAVQNGAQDYLVKGEFGAYVLNRAARHAIERHRILHERDLLLHDLALAETKQRSIIDNMLDSLITITIDGEIKFVNKTTRQLFGYENHELIDHKIDLLIPALIPSDNALDFDESIQAAMSKRVGSIFEMTGQKSDGALFPVAISMTEMWLGNQRLFITMVRDISEIEEHKVALKYQGLHDHLTGLPNRQMISNILAQTCHRSIRNQQMVATLFLDVDRFKRINDTLDHEQGDQLLKTIADRLTACIDDHDDVGRLGGDEFVVIINGINHAQDAVRTAQKILDILSQPIIIGTNELFITASIGVSLCPNDARVADDVLKHAEIAMYRAKSEGRNNLQLYSMEMESQAVDHLAMESSLRRALSNQELVLFYQAQRSMRSGEIVGMEALIRWNHPELGLVGPGEFIALAEESGLIIPMGEWVLREACQQCCQWIKQGFEDLKVSVNLSPTQFRQENLCDMVLAVLKETGLPPANLCLEITESSSMQDATFTIETLTQFKEMGVQVAIDDFGTGYSSLSYLKRFPIDTLKIDRSFVQDITVDPNDAAIVHAVIAMAHSMNLKAVAEGVETPEQEAFLHRLRCDETQGYLFSRPLNPENATEFLTQQRNKLAQKTS